MKIQYMKAAIIVCLCVIFCGVPVRAEVSDKPDVEEVTVDSMGYVNFKICTEGNDSTYEWDDDDWYSTGNQVGTTVFSETTVNHIEIYRSDTMDGTYTLVGDIPLTDSQQEALYQDITVQMGNTYFYKMRYKEVIDGTESYGEYNEVRKVVVIPSPSPIQYVRATKKNTFSIVWGEIQNVDGYELYVKEFNNEELGNLHQYAQYESDNSIPKITSDAVNAIPFTKIATCSNVQNSYVYKKASHGKGYIFAIKSYKNINGSKVESDIMYCAHGVMDYYYCENAENPKFEFKWPKNEKQAKKMMKVIRVKTWDYVNHAKHKGKKKTRIQWLTVNKKLAPTIVQIYKEIYESKEKPPIYEAGSYRWRKEESTWSYHTVGTAIDMNCNENPYYTYNSKGKRVISVGSFYKPKKNGYSIPRNGVIENTFLKYGFYRLNNDLMHFNTDGSVYSSTNYNRKK